MASSPANIERDHGVGYTCSIRSMSDRSPRASRRMSTRTRSTSIIARSPSRRRERGGRSAAPRRLRRSPARARHGGAPRGRARGVVRRHGAPARGDLLAVAHGAVADVRAAPLDHETGCGEAGRAAALEREDLVPTRVDHGDGARRARRERVQRGDARDRDAQRDGERPGGHEPHAQAGVAPGRCRRRSRDVAGLEPGLRQRSSTSCSTRTAREARSPSTSPSRTSVPWPHPWPCQTRGSAPVDSRISRAFSEDSRLISLCPSTVCRNHPHARGGGTPPRPRATRRTRPRRRSRARVAPLGVGHAVEAVEVEVRDVEVALVAVPDRVGRAGDRPLDPERRAPRRAPRSVLPVPSSPRRPRRPAPSWRATARRCARSPRARTTRARPSA